MNKDKKDKVEDVGEDKTKKQQNIIAGDKWLQYEISKYFGIIGLIIMSVERFAIAEIMGTRPVGSQWIYPSSSLNIKPALLKFVLVFLS